MRFKINLLISINKNEINDIGGYRCTPVPFCFRILPCRAVFEGFRGILVVRFNPVFAFKRKKGFIIDSVFLVGNLTANSTSVG